jgi:hypothetical protein
MTSLYPRPSSSGVYTPYYYNVDLLSTYYLTGKIGSLSVCFIFWWLMRSWQPTRHAVDGL